MLVVGSKYIFNEIDKKNLKQTFKEITFVKYDGKKTREVRKEIEGILALNNYQFIVLNIEIYIDKNTIKYLTLLQFRLQKRNIKIITIENFLEKFLQKCYIPDDDRDLNFLSDIRAYNAFELFLKRVIDYFGGGVLFLINFFIKFYVKKRIDEESPGEIYFVQDRVGLNTKTFKCYKFRTMHENSYHNPYTSKNDDRVFKFGKTMRKMRIDEIPQYINVLKGDMHIIGPRAEWDILVKNYEKEIPYYNERHLVRPGITGWAQVNYPYGENAYDAKQKLMYDLYYIKHWSLWLEARTIIKTILTVIKKQGT
ncbi:sugar transferase [Campylobacter sp. PS10]|uniref:Sugar transferase n=1 Tax=Campylobacter gastrosuis TaxID=2974576 RepID=A0ABT7HNR9_9BACT|nr:sugar transferase [Campylobacter gastrosuis]MDL0088295.1 sugar transferase [Campylobacter gastrosuis]